MSYMDFQAVKDDNPIEVVAERLGLTLKKSGSQLRGPCPSGAEGDRKFVITPSKGLWYSFALQQGGDVLALVALVNDCSTKEAAAWLTGEDTTEPLEKSKGRSKPQPKERGFQELEYLQPDHDAVGALRLDEIAEVIGIGYAPRGILRGKVAVPIRTADGALIGYLGIEDCQVPPSWHV